MILKLGAINVYTANTMRMQEISIVCNSNPKKNTSYREVARNQTSLT